MVNIMSRVALIGDNSIEYVDLLIDIWNNGDCAVLIDWRIPFLTAVEMMREASVKQCFIEKRLTSGEDISKVQDIEFIVFERNCNSAKYLPSDVYDKFQNNYSQNEAVVIYSSGTTGKSKGIILSHFAINMNADAIIDYMQPTNDDCIYIAKTLSHSSTLTGELLVALKSKIKLVIAPTIVPPRFVLNNIEKYKVSIIGVNPTLLNMYADEFRYNKYILTSLKTIYVSGSVLNDKIYNKAHDVFRNINIYNVYGLSEAGPRVTAQREDCCKENSVGRPIKGVEIAIVNEQGECVQVGERGVIHVNTKSLYSGYIVGTEKNKSLYNGWLNTGDIGYFDEYDELHVVDRADDVIIIDSHKIYPSEVVSWIYKFADIDECIVTNVEFRDENILCCLYTGSTEIVKDIKNKLSTVIMRYEIPRMFIKVDYIIKTMNNKVDLPKNKNIIIKSLEWRIRNEQG